MDKLYASKYLLKVYIQKGLPSLTKEQLPL